MFVRGDASRRYRDGVSDMPAGPEAALPGRVLRPSLLHRLSAEGPERQRLLSDVQGARTPRVHGPEHSPHSRRVPCLLRAQVFTGERERGDAFSFPPYFAPNFLLFLPPFFYFTPLFIYLQSSPTFLIFPSPQVMWRRRERVPVDWRAGTAGQPPEPQSEPKRVSIC